MSPAARTPPSGTMIVWSLTLAETRLPSTWTVWSRMPPSRAAIVLSSTRSIGPPDVLVIVATLFAWNARVPNFSDRPTR